MTDEAKKPEPVSTRFVYVGRRNLTDKSVRQVFYQIGPDGTLNLDKPRIFKSLVKRPEVGWVFEVWADTDAFDSLYIAGKYAPRLIGNYQDETQVIRWQIEDRKIDQAKDAKQNEAELRKAADVIRRAMLPIRKAMHAKGVVWTDWVHWRNAVLQELDRPLTKEEQEDA